MRCASTLKSVLPGKPWVCPERGTFLELCVHRFRIPLDQHWVSFNLCEFVDHPLNQCEFWEQVIYFALMGPNPSPNCVTLCLAQ